MLTSELSPFQSFLQGGFEGASHRRFDGLQLDLIAATRHDKCARLHYEMLAKLGIRTIRDSLRWHLIEQVDGSYDWSSFRPMLTAAKNAGQQVIWDLCHWGVPHHIDIWSETFVERFGRFSAAAAQVIKETLDEVPFYCPINEISFWSWCGGDRKGIYPFAENRGEELKRQLVRATVESIRCVREVDPRARFIQAEPIINIVSHPERPNDRQLVESYREAQFHAWDMLAGRRDPELGGAENCLDLIGVNYYFNNQWIHEFETMGFGHRLYRPVEEMLKEVADRYGRSIMVSETGAEDGAGAGWLSYMMVEVRQAMRRGVPIIGICLYPVMDYPGWDDGRHCPTGIIKADLSFQFVELDPRMVSQIEEEHHLFSWHNLGQLVTSTAFL